MEQQSHRKSLLHGIALDPLSALAVHDDGGLSTAPTGSSTINPVTADLCRPIRSGLAEFMEKKHIPLPVLMHVVEKLLSLLTPDAPYIPRDTRKLRPVHTALKPAKVSSLVPLVRRTHDRG